MGSALSQTSSAATPRLKPGSEHYEEEADVTQRMEIVQREIEGLSQDVTSAGEHTSNTIEYWETSST